MIMMTTHIDGVVVDVLEYAGVVVDLSLEESWWRWRWTLGRIGRLQVETGRRAHSLRQSPLAISHSSMLSALSFTLQQTPQQLL